MAREAALHNAISLPRCLVMGVALSAMLMPAHAQPTSTTSEQVVAERSAAAPPGFRYGVWQGTVGGQSVVAQLASGAQFCDAGYYYRKHRLSIPMQEVDGQQGKVWKEFLGTDQEATWTLTAASADGRSLSGEWVGREGQRRLPIVLQLLKPTPVVLGEDGNPRHDCAATAPAFDASRVAQTLQERKVSAADSVFQGADAAYRYQPVSLLDGNVEGFSLVQPHQQPRLQQMMVQWQSQTVAQYYDCAFNLAANRSEVQTPDFHQSLSPLFWSARVLVLGETYSNYCGGAHPNGGLWGYHIWDMRQDRPLSVWRWVKGMDHNHSIAAPRLLRLLWANYSSRYARGDDGGCADVVGDTSPNSYFQPYPKTTGMVFSLSLAHVIQACEEDIEIPWAKLRPFLTPEGKKAAADLFGVR